MEVVDTAQINSFASEPQNEFVPQSEEPVFILTSSQLSNLITKAVEKAIQPFKDEVLELKATVTRLDRDNAALQATQDTHADNQLIQLRLINEIREATKKEPQPLQKDRGDILRALIAANGGKMLAKDARQKMHLGKDTFSQLLKMCDFLEIKQSHNDKRKSIIMLRGELV
jgi:hypothetical protein